MKKNPKIEKALQFAVKKYGVDEKKARDFMTRRIQWNVIKAYQFHERSREVTCEVCNKKERGGYWCSPCVHHDFCCECCILMGIPEYSSGLFFFGKYGVHGSLKTNLACGGSVVKNIGEVEGD